MSFPRYPKYKESGVEWLGEIPESWTKIKLGRLFEAPPCYGVLVPDFEEGGIPMLRITDMEGGRTHRSSMTTISPALSAQYSRTMVEEGDVVLSVVGTIGEAFQIDADLAGVNLSRAVARIQVGAEIEARFLCWIFQSQPFRRYVDLTCVGTAQRVLNMADLSAYVCAMPTMSEQLQIAAFLDCETAKIDALVAEQRRLMELLKEKRQAVISHAVTKGLNPHAPMKDSGIDLLGDVPAHWDVKRLKYLLRKGGLVRGPFGGDLKKEIFEKAGIKVYEQRNAIYRDAELGDSYISESKFAEMRRFEVFAGDYIMSCSGTIGKTYRIPAGARAGIINQALLIIRFSDCMCYRYADWIFDAEFFITQILDNSQGGAMKNLVGMDVFTAISLPVPPVDEQQSIARFLDGATAELDDLTKEAQRAINLLQERRTALISAAVTGQIDVRQLADKQAAA